MGRKQKNPKKYVEPENKVESDNKEIGIMNEQLEAQLAELGEGTKGAKLKTKQEAEINSKAITQEKVSEAKKQKLSKDEE